MNIFISHISEETSIAEVLKDWIESTFLGQSEVFASSATDDLPAGNKWIDEIDQALDSAVAFLVLCSPASLKRTWIHLETGWGWIKGLPIIPICHSGQKKDDLPSPISTFQALEIDSDGFRHLQPPDCRPGPQRCRPATQIAQSFRNGCEATMVPRF